MQEDRGDVMAKGQIKQKQANINQKQFETLCAIQCTEEEIMAMFDVSKDTLIRWCKNTYGADFATIYKEKRQNGKASLRRNQFKLAETNPTMAIWLGKQYLGQKDHTEQEIVVKEKTKAEELSNELFGD